MNDIFLNWDQIVENLGPRLLRYFAARFSRLESSELVQETLVRLFEKINSHEFDPQKGNIGMFAFGIARLVGLEANRKQLYQDKYTDSKIHGDQFREPTYLIDLKNEMQKLSHIEQDILLLFYNDFLITEISDLMSLPSGTVKSHLHRSKNKLRKALIGDDHE